MYSKKRGAVDFPKETHKHLKILLYQRAEFVFHEEPILWDRMELILFEPSSLKKQKLNTGFLDLSDSIVMEITNVTEMN